MKRALVTLCLVLWTVLPGSADPGPSMDECGQLRQVGSCLVFHSFEEGGVEYMLDNYGEFLVGDIVHVSGEFDALYTPCGDTDIPGWVYDNTVTACEREDLGCVVMSIAPPEDTESCSGFRHDGYWIRFRPGGVASGDSVHVRGVVDCTAARRMVHWCLRHLETARHFMFRHIDLGATIELGPAPILVSVGGTSV